MALEPAQESRVLLEPAEPRASQLFPAWSPDGGSLYFTEASPVVDAEGRIQGAEVWLSRVAASGGVPQRLVPDALFASLSADGSRLAFLRWSPAGGGTSIWVAGPEGEGGREVLPASGFVALHAPRISPNGRWIAFSAAPAEESRMSWLERLLRVRAAQAHGAPMLLYRFDLDRDELLPVTGWLEDDLAATWSPDGQWLAFQALEGKLVLADWRASALYLASAQAGRGLLAWGP